MNTPLQITFRNMKPSQAVEEHIREQASKLERFNGRVVGCRVIVEVPHLRHNKGNMFHVSVDLTIPGAELVATRRGEDPDVYIAVRDAFNHARRELTEFTDRRRDLERSGADRANITEPQAS